MFSSIIFFVFGSSIACFLFKFFQIPKKLKGNDLHGKLYMNIFLKESNYTNAVKSSRRS